MLPKLAAWNGVKGLAEVEEASIQPPMLTACLHCFARLNECPHDEDVVSSAVIAPEPSLNRSPRSSAQLLMRLSNTVAYNLDKTVLHVMPR